MKRFIAECTNVTTRDDFEKLALKTFHFQAKNVPVYRDFIQYLKINPHKIKNIQNIPFLPLTTFKSHRVIADGFEPEIIFKSSGTTGTKRSQHLVALRQQYESTFLQGFELFYTKPSDYTILALLPSYAEQGDSSLIYMADKLISASEKKNSGFFLNNTGQLMETLERLDSAGEKVLLLGVSYALLDLIEKHNFQLKNTLVMETGGMKGRRKEMIREELHARLTKGFGVEKIHSEYGMTELLSQAYSKGDGIFHSPPWMKIIIRDANDPFVEMPIGTSGGINIIDLANQYSCSFLSTQDLGKSYSDGSFEVIGRFDYSDLRGCNLLLS